MSIAKDSTLTSGQLRGSTGPMAKLPWGEFPVIQVNSGAGSQGINRVEQQDGGAGWWTLVCNSAGAPNGSGLVSVLRSSGFGIRGRRNSNATSPPVDVIVDGRCVEAFRTTKPLVNGIDSGSYTDNEVTFEWPHPLKRTLHTVSVRIDAHPDNTTVNQFPLSGYLLPRADGFKDTAVMIRKGFIGPSTALTTTAVLFGPNYFDATRCLRFKNTDSAAHTVTLYREDGTTIYDMLSIPAGAGVTVASAVYTFPQPLNLNGWKWKADANSFVTGWLEGA